MRLKHLRDRVDRISPAGTKAAAEDKIIRKILSGFSKEEQANLAGAIVARRRQEPPFASDEEWIRSLPSEQAAAVNKYKLGHELQKQGGPGK